VVVLGFVLVGIAALIHVYVFYLESIAWTSGRARSTFGIATVQEAEVMRLLAFNQGFYNLFLAVAIALGVVFAACGAATIGATLAFTGAGSMVAAGLVLLLSDRRKARAALIQLGPPLLGIIALAVGSAS
jgi:putative membrane protein